MNKEAYKNRVVRFRKLMEERGYDAAVIRNNADLRWLTGAERTFDFEQAHTAFITADELFLHTDSRYFNTFVERLGSDSDWTLDQDTATHPAWIANKVLASKARVVAIEDTLSLAFASELERELNRLSISVLLPQMHEDIAVLRIQKDEAELELMAHAQSITDAAFAHIVGFVKPGMTEQEVRLELESFMYAQGADSLAFDTIMATGPNGANPHAQPGDTKIKRGDLIVMDYGAGYRDYNSDMTRMVSMGEPSAEQQKVYDIVRSAHEQCAAAAKPGCIGRDIHNLAVEVIREAGYGDYFGHGLGHGVGLEVHEKPYFNARYIEPIPVGAVITIEPGIYLPGKFGVRLEDYGVMREEGFVPFTKSSHELAVVDC